MTTPQDRSQDLTPAMLEMQSQLAQLQQELAQLKQHAQTLPPATTAPSLAKPPSTLSGSRRKTLKRLALVLLGGAAAATAVTVPTAQAKVIANPILGISNSRAGALVLPPTVAAPVNNAPGDSYFGLIALGVTSAFDLSTLPSGEIGVYSSGASTGVYGNSSNGYAVYGNSSNGYAVYGNSSNGYGVAGVSFGYIGVFGSSTGYAGYFSGDVHLTGTLTGGTKSFKIDHPLDPANKYLYHTSVESPDMKNIYDGVVTLDEQGEATITMPDWFDALNSDFRYQLTSIGNSMPDLFIAQELTNRQFKIAGGKPGQKVSWMVTGIRQDAYAKAHRSPVEADKTGDEKGKYIHPELFGQPEEKSVSPRPPQNPPQGPGK